jgi:hypothetical protein
MRRLAAGERSLDKKATVGPYIATYGPSVAFKILWIARRLSRRAISSNIAKEFSVSSVLREPIRLMDMLVSYAYGIYVLLSENFPDTNPTQHGQRKAPFTATQLPRELDERRS